MSHPEQRAFCAIVQQKYPKFFSGVKVLDIGSLDINGSNRSFFTNCEYHGIDIGPGKGVDYVCRGHEWQGENEYYDCIISTECFEHDQFYALTLKNAVRMLKKGGLLIFTCATTGRPEHGTRRTSPEDSPLTCATAGWEDYYKNLTQTDIESVLDCATIFSKYAFETNDQAHDLYFYGIKSGNS